MKGDSDMRFITTRRTAVTAAALALVAMTAWWEHAQADTPSEIQIAIPTNFFIVSGQTHMIFTGRSSTIATVACAPGTPWPQAAVLVDPGSGTQAEITGVLVFHDHELPAGSRYLITAGPTLITAGPTPCNSELRLYTAKRL
jgi:hypothetical protein